jgi:hypothetical protein
MRYLGCEQKTNIVIPEIAGDIPISSIGLDLLISQFRANFRQVDTGDNFRDVKEMMEILNTNDPVGLGNKELNDALTPQMDHELLLSLVRVDTNRYKMFLDPHKNADKVGNIQLSELFDYFNTPAVMILVLEALWEQLYFGEGPLCFCDPYVPDDCPYKPILAQVWQQTKPDPPNPSYPEWKPNWKQGDPPFCIRDIIKSETATAVNALLMSRVLDENGQLTDAEKALLIYQWFSREKLTGQCISERATGMIFCSRGQM